MGTEQTGPQGPDSLLSTSEAARLAGVTPSTMKRWADEGIVECERTAGGHRRFRRSALNRLFRQSSEPEESAIPGDQWVTALVEGAHHTTVSRLFELRQQEGSWSGAADALRPVLTALGDAWRSGSITVAEEHLATECFLRAIAQVCLSLPTRRNPKRALLATAEGESHELGLRLAELCLRERQWRSVWLGNNTPTDSLIEHIESAALDVAIVSASPWITTPEQLGEIAARLQAVCVKRDVTLVLAGEGSWPAAETIARVSTYQEFDRLLTMMS